MRRQETRWESFRRRQRRPGWTVVGVTVCVVGGYGRLLFWDSDRSYETVVVWNEVLERKATEEYNERKQVQQQKQQQQQQQQSSRHGLRGAPAAAAKAESKGAWDELVGHVTPDGRISWLHEPEQILEAPEKASRISDGTTERSTATAAKQQSEQQVQQQQQQQYSNTSRDPNPRGDRLRGSVHNKQQQQQHSNEEDTGGFLRMMTFYFMLRIYLRVCLAGNDRNNNNNNNAAAVSDSNDNDNDDGDHNGQSWTARLNRDRQQRLGFASDLSPSTIRAVLRRNNSSGDPMREPTGQEYQTLLHFHQTDGNHNYNNNTVQHPAPPPQSANNTLGSPSSLQSSIIMVDPSEELESNVQCPVCSAPFRLGDSVITTPCLHRFHTACLRPHQMQNSRLQFCPACMYVIR